MATFPKWTYWWHDLRRDRDVVVRSGTLFLFFVFLLCERKKRKTDKMGSTVLPQAIT